MVQAARDRCRDETGLVSLHPIGFLFHTSEQNRSPEFPRTRVLQLAAVHSNLCLGRDTKR